MREKGRGKRPRTYIVQRRAGRVNPGLVSDSVREPAVGPADSDVHNEVKGWKTKHKKKRKRKSAFRYLPEAETRARRVGGRKSVEFELTSIERRRIVVALEPGVDKGDLLGPVVDDGWEVASLEKRLLLEVERDHLVDAGVDICGNGASEAERGELPGREEDSETGARGREGTYMSRGTCRSTRDRTS